ncbi:MAG TPA: CpaD family pilus assembly lipoprotein [Allosphingosinicella sp.]|nr:CpaD family pilus assembly lipoprotein [Allosphingosinicella sp.]
MSRLLSIAAVSAFGLVVGGCSTQPDQLEVRRNYSLYSLHQPVVERTSFVFDVATQGDGVSASEQGRLAAWFDSIGLRYGDSIAIDGGDYDSNGAKRDVARVASAHGLLIADAGAPVTEGAVPPGYVRVVASRATASVDGCPSWNDPGIESPVRTGSNYGCATNTNLSAMIANPEDLIQGREPSGNGAAQTAGRAARAYRESPPTGRQGLPAATTTPQGR